VRKSTGTHFNVDNQAHIQPNSGVVFAYFCQKGFQIIGMGVVPPSGDVRNVLK
jgi:hypothetical protein